MKIEELSNFKYNKTISAQLMNDETIEIDFDSVVNLFYTLVDVLNLQQLMNDDFFNCLFLLANLDFEKTEERAKLIEELKKEFNKGGL